MCLRTGPWDKYIVMTNCESIKHEGVRTEKDISICIGTFRNITSEEWVKMCEIEGNKIIPETNKNVTEEDVRSKIDIDKHFAHSHFYIDYGFCDLYFWGIKK
jgi:hypothetical protein